jgi:hypothetical protein
MPPEDDSPYPRYPAEKGRRAGLLWAALAVVVLAGGATYYFWSKPGAPRVAPPARTDPAPARPPAGAEPAIRHPLAVAPAPAEKPLPALDESDASLWQELAALLGAKPLEALLRPERLARNIVATVDNLPRETAHARVNPVLPTPGAFEVQREGGATVIGPRNAQRYAARLRLLQSVDARRLVDLYLRFYPLLQKAYEELGYPGRYFNDRLIEAIDDMLAAPDLMKPAELVQPKVLYRYADPAFEARSAGQKIMIRMGVGNEGLAKAKLREIRREILGRAPKQ